MKPIKTRLLTTTVIPLAIAAGFTLVAVSEIPSARAAQSLAQKSCNPCAAKRGCNPCAAKKACNPCAAKNPCNPCAAKRACNPCAAKTPCNPCGASNPCAGGAVAYSSKCVIPRLASANPCAAKNPCNPCAAERACNPCAAKNPCNPCAAKNPCNPCAATNPCNPCGAAAEVKLSNAEALAVYDCLKGEMKTAYAKSGNLWAKWYSYWGKASTQPYVSSTHGNRFVHNYASKKAIDSYRKFEKGGKMVSGGVLAKDSFTVTPKGQVSVGPLFLMEKMKPGFMKASNDWRYTLIMPNGQTIGTTNGKGSKNVQFCITCHQAVAEDQDAMFFLPEEYRVN